MNVTKDLCKASTNSILIHFVSFEYHIQWCHRHICLYMRINATLAHTVCKTTLIIRQPHSYGFLVLDEAFVKLRNTLNKATQGGMSYLKVLSHLNDTVVVNQKLNNQQTNHSLVYFKHHCTISQRIGINQHSQLVISPQSPRKLHFKSKVFLPAGYGQL